MFWSDDAADTTNRVKLAEYFWRESGKWAEDATGRLRRAELLRPVGGRRGFKPIEDCRDIDKWVYVELRRVYRKLIDKRLQAEAERAGRKYRKYHGPRGLDGLTLFVPEAPTLAGRLEEWAYGEALRKSMEREAARHRATFAA